MLGKFLRIQAVANISLDLPKPLQTGNLAVSKGTIKQACEFIILYGVFKYNLVLEPQQKMRISKFFDKAIADGRLMSGIWQKRTYLGA